MLVSVICRSPLISTIPVLNVALPLVVRAPPSATRNASSTSNPPFKFALPTNVEIPDTSRVPVTLVLPSRHHIFPVVAPPRVNV